MKIHEEMLCKQYFDKTQVPARVTVPADDISDSPIDQTSPNSAPVLAKELVAPTTIISVPEELPTTVSQSSNSIPSPVDDNSPDPASDEIPAPVLQSPDSTPFPVDDFPDDDTKSTCSSHPALPNSSKFFAYYKDDPFARQRYDFFSLNLRMPTIFPPSKFFPPTDTIYELSNPDDSVTNDKLVLPTHKLSTPPVSNSLDDATAISMPKC